LPLSFLCIIKYKLIITHMNGINMFEKRPKHSWLKKKIQRTWGSS
jgi:hypothetical protein